MIIADAGTFGWNFGADVQGMLAFHFMVNAFRAGAIAALLAGVTGWLMVLRRESFVGHTLAVVGFPGAAGATLIGVSATAGLLAFCIACALVIALLPRGNAARGFSEESAVVGTLQALALGCGFLFVSLYHGYLNGVNALLFGSFLGITDTQVLTLAVVAVLALVVLAAIGRPLLFGSIDPAVAEVGGVPVRALSALFLVVLGVAAAEVSEITGALLVFALLVLPPATAQTLTARPALGLLVSVLVGLAATWLGLTIAFYSPYPVGFLITSLAFAAYAAARLARWRPALPRLRGAVGGVG